MIKVEFRINAKDQSLSKTMSRYVRASREAELTRSLKRGYQDHSYSAAYEAGRIRMPQIRFHITWMIVYHPPRVWTHARIRYTLYTTAMDREHAYIWSDPKSPIGRLRGILEHSWNIQRPKTQLLVELICCAQIKPHSCLPKSEGIRRYLAQQDLDFLRLQTPC